MLKVVGYLIAIDASDYGQGLPQEVRDQAALELMKGTPRFSDLSMGEFGELMDESCQGFPNFPNDYEYMMVLWNEGLEELEASDRAFLVVASTGVRCPHLW